MIFISIYSSYLCLSFASYCVHTPLESKPIDSSLSPVSYLHTFEGGALLVLSPKLKNVRVLQLSLDDKVYKINIKT